MPDKGSEFSFRLDETAGIFISRNLKKNQILN